MTQLMHRGAARRAGLAPDGRSRQLGLLVTALLATTCLAACSADAGGVTTAGPADLGIAAANASGDDNATGAADDASAPPDAQDPATPAVSTTTPVVTSSGTALAVPSLTAKSRVTAASGSMSTKAAAARGKTTASGTVSTSPAPTGPVLLLGPATEVAAEAEVVRLVNVEREEHGCADVAVDATLVQLARAHSQDMASVAGFKHNGSDGRTPFQRMMAAGYVYSIAAENIAAGQPSAAAVMAAWMASDGHRMNILDCRFTQIGVGMTTRTGSAFGVYWTQEFGAPLTSQSAAPSS